MGDSIDIAAGDSADIATTRAAQKKLFLRVFPSVMLPMFMAAIDQTIVATALPAIASELGDVERISWIVVSYLVSATIAAPVFGRLGDALGRRRMLFVAMGVFLAASVLCALAPSLLFLTAARLLQGIGGGGMLTLCQAVIGETVPPRERGRYQGYISAVFVSASMFGPVAGGYLTQILGWQAVFEINLPLGALAYALVLRLPDRKPSGTRFVFDLWGTIFFTAFVTPVLLALERVQHFNAGAILPVTLLVLTAAAALILLLRQERRAPFPLLPLKLFAMPAIWRTNLMGFFIGGSVIALVSFVPIYLEVVRDLTPGHTGFLMLPLTAGVGSGALFTGRMIARTQRAAIFPSLGLPVTTASLFFLAFFMPRLSTGSLPWLFGLISLSIGTGMTVVQVVVQTVAGPKHLGSAAASVQISRSVGGAFCTAIVGAVLFATLSARDPAAAALFTDLAERGPAVLGGIDAARRAVIGFEIADAFRAAFLTIALYCACAVGLAWTLPTKRL
jgi:MFS family permease